MKIIILQTGDGKETLREVKFLNVTQTGEITSVNCGKLCTYNAIPRATT